MIDESGLLVVRQAVKKKLACTEIMLLFFLAGIGTELKELG